MLSDIVEQTTIKMDYKVHLKSQYITNRVSELANQPLEIGFLYGGTYTQDTGPKHEINITDIYLPTKQKISGVTFDFEETSSLSNFTRPKRIVGVGHSHANMDVFHSPRDYQKFHAFTTVEGISINNYQPKRRANRKSLSEHLKTYKALRQEQPTQVLTSFVYNMKQKLQTALMTLEENNTFTITEERQIEYYNKKATLTIDEKKELDYRIQQILTYNNIKRTVIKPSGFMTEKRE